MLRMCKVEGCDKKIHARGYCTNHYNQKRYHGTIELKKPNHGNMNVEERFFYNIKKMENGCWEWQGSTSKYGYGQMTYKGQRRYTHRVSYMIHNNVELETKDIIMHTCDNPPCCNPEHLKKGTHAENTQDMLNKKRNKVGEEFTKTILTEEQVLEIRKLYKKWKYSMARLSKEYGVSHSTIQKIINRESWKHI